MPSVLNALGLRPRSVHSRPRAQFFSIRTEPKSVNNVYVLLSSKEQLMNYKNLDCYEKLAIVDWFGGSGEGFF